MSNEIYAVDNEMNDVYDVNQREWYNKFERNCWAEMLSCSIEMPYKLVTSAGFNTLHIETWLKYTK